MTTPSRPWARPVPRLLLPAIALCLAGMLDAATPTPAYAQQTDWDAVEIVTEQVAPGVYVLFGRGGNIGVSVGEDGVFVIDDQFAPLTEKILAAIAAITSEEVRFVINTHWHGDHTGGNENLAGKGALVVAHENVLQRLSMDQVLERVGRPVTTTPAAPKSAWPVITFTRDMSFRLNGDRIHAVHVPNAHTDGDAIIHFENANVVHMGDTFFRGRFPFIDTASGGSIDGAISATAVALGRMNAETRVIPGHGDLATRADLREYRDALMAMRDAVADLMAAGHSLEEIQAARPVRAQAEAWEQGREAEDAFVATLFHSLGGA